MHKSQFLSASTFLAAAGLLRVGRVQLYTGGLDAEEQRITGVEIIGSLDAAIADSIARHGDGAIAIVPEGPYVIPVAGA